MLQKAEQGAIGVDRDPLFQSIKDRDGGAKHTLLHSDELVHGRW